MSGDLSRERDERLTHQNQTILKPKNLEILNLNQITFTHSHNSSLEYQIMERMETDSISCSILQTLNRKYTKHPQVFLGECNVDGKLLLVNGLIDVPDYHPLRLEIIPSCHDCPAAGHPGRCKTYELVSSNYWWLGLRKYLAHSVDHYQRCSKFKVTRHALFDKLKPVENPQHP